jgi:magnesium transporter
MSKAVLIEIENSPQHGLRTLIDRPGLLWLDLDDPQSKSLDELAAQYGFHELAIEDCRHPIQRAKLDYYDGHAFVIINSTHYTETPCQVRLRELAAFIGRDYIVTVHYGQSLSIDEVQRRLASSAHRYGRPDQVLHAVIDIVVDRYLPTLESMGDTIDRIEDELLVDPSAHHLETIFDLKRGLLQFRRAVSSQRELLNIIIRDETPIISPDMRLYFRDVYDHTVRANEMVETYRDLVTGGLDIYLTQMANRTNDTVKGLTILATIMLPLTLVTGYFGMNFDYIPTLKDPAGIWYITGGLLAITFAMLAYFRHKGWL